MTFWIFTSAMALVVSAALGLVLLRARTSAEPAAAYDLRVYRDQLKDVDRDLERGVIGETDATRIRTEVSRRILAADTQLQAERAGLGQSRALSVGMAAILGIALIGGSLGLYRLLGAPGYGDLSLSRRIDLANEARETRPDQAAAEASLPPFPPVQGLSEEYLGLLERLRATVAERPDDVQGQTLLARNEAASGNFVAAHEAQAEVLRLKAGKATAQDFTDYADMLVLAAGGYVSPEAEAALRAALELDPGNGPARYYWGLMLGQTGRPDLAFRVWDALLRQGPADAPWIEPVRAQIEDMAGRAGVEFTAPPAIAPPSADPAQPGPSQADIQAASEMTDEERMQMIRNMVEGLSERLSSKGGTPPEWARLIGALTVLGEETQARAIYDNAQEMFAGNAKALEVIDDSARRSGLIP